MTNGYVIRLCFVKDETIINHVEVMLGETEDKVKADIFSKTKYTKLLLDGYKVDFYECTLLNDAICARNTTFDTLKYYSDNGTTEGIYINLIGGLPTEFVEGLTELIQKYIPTWTLNRK